MKLPLPNLTLPALRKPRFERPALPDRSDLVLLAGGACLVAACLFVFAGPGLDEVQQTSRERAVRTNAATLQLAAETYAAMHQGRYADDALDLLSLLPHDRAPRNPYTGDPVDFSDAPGDLTYRISAAGEGYVIEAWGDAAAAEPLLRLTGAFAPRSCADGLEDGRDSMDAANETAVQLRLMGRPAARASATGI